MTVLAEIVCSVAQEEATQAAVEAFCKESGSQLIGRRANEETQKVQLIVLLPITGSEVLCLLQFCGRQRTSLLAIPPTRGNARACEEIRHSVLPRQQKREPQHCSGERKGLLQWQQCFS